MNHPAYAVEMRGITKRFGSVVANDGVDLAVAPGEIHCLLGENGAGKSTLMKILFGLYPRDAGEIRLRGEPIELSNPAQAIQSGIGMVHQHFMLVDRLTVTENVIAGMEPTRRGLIDFERARERIAAVARAHGLAVDPDARIEELSVGEQQRVEIVKCLMREADVLILDEPTAVLTPQEVDELFHVMLRLKEAGKTLIFITHKLRETMAFSDRVTVLRRGKNAGTLLTRESSPEALAELMVGRRVTLAVQRPPTTAREPLLKLERVTVEGAAAAGSAKAGDRRAAKRRLDEVSLEVRSGEILGVAGVEGNGQLELEEVVTGIRPPASGRVLIRAKSAGDVPNTGEAFVPVRSPNAFRACGGAHIPSDRLRRGLVPSFPLSRNGILGRQWVAPFSRLGLLRRASIERHAARLIETFDVRGGDPSTEAGALSGGNQQKFVVGRELAHEPQVIVAAQPTRGVDVGAIERIHQELLTRRAQGAAVLLISAELDELLALADRLVVLYEGRIVAQGPAGEFSQTELGLLMAGQSREGGGNVRAHP